MAYPEVDKGLNSSTQAIQQLSVQQFPMVTHDMIDWQLSNAFLASLYPPIAPVWSNPEKMFRGNQGLVGIYKPAAQLPAGAVFRLWFNRPIFISYVVLAQLPSLLPALPCTVMHLDGTAETLTPIASTVYGRGYSPPAGVSPVVSIAFSNLAGLVAIDLYNLYIMLANITVTSTGSPFPGIVASANNYYSDESYNVIPPGFLGITLLFGFSSEAFIVKNSSSSLLEFSEDGGLTWEKVNANDTVWFDAKARNGIILRDPAGAGGQAYRVWGW